MPGQDVDRYLAIAQQFLENFLSAIFHTGCFVCHQDHLRVVSRRTRISSDWLTCDSRADRPILKSECSILDRSTCRNFDCRSLRPEERMDRAATRVSLPNQIQPTI